MTQPPKNRPPSRKVAQPNQNAQPIQGRPRQGSRAYAAPPRRDPFPIVIGAIMGVLVVGLLVLVYMLASNQNKGGTPNPNPVAQVPTTAASDNPTALAVDPNATAGPTEEPAPRMPLADFMTLYNDPAKRPLIIDVRAKEAYDAGHIAGAISFPESDVDTRISELPKDKLIVAYCQWPAENESARVAQKLHSQYGFSYNTLQVLLGGWNTWNQEHAKDPAKYPEGGTAATPGADTAPSGGTSDTTAVPQITVVITPQP